ncbi:MAG: hypothetical protein ACYCW6_13505 [Candidatus Xenobia bacterium]
MSKSLKFCLLTASLATLLVVGCNNSQPQAEIKTGRPGDSASVAASPAAASPVAAASSSTEANAPGMPGPFMTKDPRSIQAVDGLKVVEVDGKDLIASKGSVTLHFHLTDSTVIEPTDKKLAPGETIHVDIDQVEDGMNAKKVVIKG